MNKQQDKHASQMPAGPSESTVSIHRLDNGLTVALESLPYLRSATAGIWIGAGSAQEQAEESGLAHFLEHLFFKGTKTRTVHQLMEEVEGKGGHLNAFTSREYTCLYAKTLDCHVGNGIEILADILRNSIFADLEKERNVILEEIASVEDTPDEYVHDLLTLSHWPSHALGRPVGGNTESVARLTLDDIRRFYQAWYQPSNIVVAVAGNIDEDKVLEQLRNEFGGMGAASLPGAYAPPAFHGGKVHHHRDILQSQVTLAFPGPSLGDPERYICDMTTNVLGGGSTSRLFKRIREDEGLAYSVYTFQSFYVQAGLLGVYAGVTPQSVPRTLEITFEELRRLRDEPVPQDELEMNREQIRGNMLMALESTSARMSRMGKSLLFYGRVVPIDEILAKLDAVSQEDILEFSRRKFTTANCALVTLGPEKDHSAWEVAL